MHSDIELNIFPDQSTDVKYNISNLPIFICRYRLSQFNDIEAESHWSSGMETIFVKEGSLEININGTTHILKAGDICIIHAGCMHFLRNHSSTECIYYCGIVEEALFSAAKDIISNYINPIFHSFQPDAAIIRSDSEHSRPIRDVFVRIAELAENKPPAFELLIVAGFHEYLALICQAKLDSFLLPSGSGKKNDTEMRQMLGYIRQHYMNNIQISDLYHAAGISRYQCFAIFEKYTSDTPKSFLLKYRLKEAKKLLLHTNMAISDISSACGFSHQSQFTKHFAKYYGATPLKFRKYNADTI